MHSLLLRSSPRFAAAQVAPHAVYALCLHTSHRCVFVRELSTPATLETGNSSVAPSPARLLWQFCSRRPRHLVLCVREPLPAVAPLAPEKNFEGLSAAEAVEASAVRTVAVDGAPRAQEDFMYGRLFLRPYNVAQLLTVLQGWSDLPAVVERPRSSLTLSAVPPSSTSEKPENGNSADVRPREVVLTARVTRKTTVAAPGDSGRVATPGAVAYSSTNADPGADEDQPDAVYVDGDVSTLHVVLRDADLVLLTTHLESVLSDLFAIEHCSRKMELRKALSSQHSRVSHRTGARARSFERSSARQPKYLSDRHARATRTHGHLMEKGYQSRRSDRGSHSGSRHHSFTTAPVQGKWSTLEEVSSKAAPTTATNEAEDDDYEEILEDVEEVEDGEVDHKDATETCSGATPSSQAVASAASAASSTSYITTHTRERGEMTMESADRYAEARFMRDGSVAASEVEEVGRVGDFDVRRRTRQAQGSTEKGDSRTTVHATATTGAFRSTSGEVTGSFSYERLSTTTEATSATTAAAAAAATAIPLRCETAEGDSEATATIDITAIELQPSAEVDDRKPGESESHERQMEGEKSTEAGPVKPTRKRQASGKAAAAGKKKTAKRKSRKAPAKRKAATSTTASVSAPQRAGEFADTRVL
ncbi:conserved hypothetical protein [Leishmania mexicana MHOM/GT/2001/U1103]|uniref:Uncharacterized protein n=1 Tax=Leishmania mexicana (strain MHOM/GT/2001/U1103) TaxID=929439 RepID=E9AZ12_LEIMU|nr:conserved hypothetical protein [Leishmania mexicana MHOM/GT/2001/U1103]CBZ28208.1 conserved hypothetical protein [Leishmania mexicana MHOM/GT/2001/U1103]